MSTTLMRVATVAAATVLASGTAVSFAQASPAPVPAPWCGNGDLTASYHGNDAAMSHVFGRIVLKNTSPQDCRIGGWGGLSYVGHGDGTQIGAAADRTPGRETVITLAPGQRVKSAVVETSFGVYSRRECRPQPVDGFRVYVPNATESQFVPHPTTGCANSVVHLISHGVYHRPHQSTASE